MISDEKINLRKAHLLKYYSKKGGTFLNERSLFLKLNNRGKTFSLADYSSRYYKFSKYFNRVFAEEDFKMTFDVDRSIFNQVVNYNKQFEKTFRDVIDDE